ncbi:hypothetical protein H7271_02190 [Bittarella massiliensis]|uniref:hypothetical protein n=1 Tax=Bittarella massiliensis (ex Durand et al. 2017) TaxID=1720313 RepID=UPI00163BF5E6|nr:hypothetical protein [Bittarella massiliensis (ex Durand et al. 2017)]MBC2870414.1 hypothetical protein [Bittarella massiliensis (ex Durand et al. 2017)]
MHIFIRGEPNWVDPLNANFQEVASTAGSAIPASEKGAAGGVATLDGSGKLVQMPTAEDVGAMAADAIQSGSNSNGSWTKWPDGTMMAYGVVTAQSVPANSTVGLLGHSISFPAAFASSPSMTLTAVADTVTFFSAKLGGVTNALWWGSVTNGSDYARDVPVHWQAIGRWK